MILMCACSVASYSVPPHGLTSTRLLCPRDFPGKNTRVGCHFLLQGIFLTIIPVNFWIFSSTQKEMLEPLAIIPYPCLEHVIWRSRDNLRSFAPGFFPGAQGVRGSPMHASALRPFLQLNNTSVCVEMAVCLSFGRRMDLWVVSPWINLASHIIGGF